MTYKEKLIKNREQYWNDLKQFQDVDDIPNLPCVDKDKWDNFYVPHLIRCGAIPKDELEINCFYKGSCRNAEIAMWNGTKFVYHRTKFGHKYTEQINHFQDDDGFDLFVPIEKINP